MSVLLRTFEPSCVDFIGVEWKFRVPRPIVQSSSKMGFEKAGIESSPSKLTRLTTTFTRNVSEAGFLNAKVAP